MLRSHRFAVLAAAGFVATFALSGCGVLEKAGLWGGGDKATLVAAQNNQLGPVVTDSEGHTLYRWDKDSARPPKSNCISECSSNWIPVTITDGTTVKGVDPSLVGVIQRSDDGKTQVTLAGWPLYKFVKDKKPGDIKGQGVAKTWWVVAPDGSKIKPGEVPGGGGGQDGGVQSGTGTSAQEDPQTDPQADPQGSTEGDQNGSQGIGGY